MAKTKISQYDATAANNTDIDSISIAEGMAPSNVNNAIRELMAHLKDMDAGTQALTSPQLTSVDINGGTIDGAVIGANSAAAITGTTITGTSLVIGSANINENDFESIDGITAGTVAASKAVIVDANKDVTGFRNVTLTGELDVATLDVSGDIDVDGTANLDVVDIDGAVDMASTLTVTGAAILNGGIDVAGDITLDAGGADILFKDDGTTFGSIINASSDFQLNANVQDKDIIFTGNDGGSGITALTLDMSAAGAATFNSSITATSLDISGDIDVDGTTNLDVVDIDGAVDMASTLTVTGAAILNGGIDVVGNITLDADDAGEIRLKDGGTQYGALKIDSSRFKIQSIISDADMLFAGNDGGSEITALTLDMSQAGSATFNAGASFNGQVQLYDNDNLVFGAGDDTTIKHDGSNTKISHTGTGGLYIGADTFGLQNGAHNATHLSIDANGHVTMPKQPAFSVHKNSTNQSNFSTNTNIILSWTHSRFDQNSDFDFVNGRFTAPVTGKYQFTGNIRLDNIDNSADYYIVFLATSNENYRFIFDPDLDGDQVYWTVSINLLADMDANDVVSLQVNQGGGSAQTDINGDAEYTYFSGYLAC